MLIVSIIQTFIDDVYLERPFSVNTLGIRVTAAIVGQTLVDVSAFDAVAHETFVAGAFVGTLCILAVGELAAGVRVQEAFVVVGAARTCFRFHGVPFLAAAVEGTNGVVTFTVAANARLIGAFVDIYQIKHSLFII